MAKSIIGTVSSTASNKTIVVRVERSKTHPLYHKRYHVTSKYMAHDEKNEAQVGDKVMISECRPISAHKHFKLTKIIEKPALSTDALKAIQAEEPKKDDQEDQS